MPIIDNMPEFEQHAAEAADIALGLLAADIERLSKMMAPVKSGALYSSVKHYTTAPLHWRISFGEDSNSDKYAIYQEFGQRRDGSHQVRNYTKPGTGSHFLEIAGSNVAMQAPGTFSTVMAPRGMGLI